MVRKQLNFITCQTIEGVLEIALNKRESMEPGFLAPIPDDIRSKARKPGLRQ